MTTPAFNTWSRISRRETSSSEAPVRATDSNSFCIGNKRIRRPGAIYFDAAGAAPFLHKALQCLVPLLAPPAGNQKCSLPKQVGLHAADLAAGRRVRRYLFQLRGQLAQARIITIRASLQPRCLLLKIFFA